MFCTVLGFCAIFSFVHARALIFSRVTSWRSHPRDAGRSSRVSMRSYPNHVEYLRVCRIRSSHVVASSSKFTPLSLLRTRQQRVKRKLYGTTRPGTLLKQLIPLKLEHWDVRQPGYVEIDLVSHSGASGAGEFLQTSDCVDLQTT